MFHKFDHYGNINCVFTSVYASLSNKYKVIDSLATNINYQLKRNKKDQPVDYFDGSVLLWQLRLCHYILMVSQLELTFPNLHIGVPEGDVLFRRRKHHCRCCTGICKQLSNS